MMTDYEIIQGLIAGDNRITEEFFFVKCRPLFCKIIGLVFSYEVDYDEFVNELYVYLMADEAAKLREFRFRSSLYHWLKIVAIRYFIKKRDKLIEDCSQEPLYEESDCATDFAADLAKADMERLFKQMPNKRYVFVIRRLILEDANPEQTAQMMNITVANLYNIRRRAVAQLTRVALKDIRNYGKQV